MPDRAFRYRYWGNIKPPVGRQPIRAEIAASSDGDTATIRLFDPIDSYGGDYGVSAKEFAAALDAIPDAKQIQLHINSPGGEVYDGIAILNALRNHPASVVATVCGIAASAASFIAAGADELVMGRNSTAMVHDAWGLCMGPASDMRDVADILDKMSDNIASVYAEKAGGELADWRKSMLAETWYSADEAVAAGLADRVEEAPQTSAPAAAFDLSVFRHQGRSDAPPPSPVPAAQAPPAGLSGTLTRRHRLNARRHALPL